MRNITIQELVKTAKIISEDENIIKDNLLLTYTLRPAHHKKLNEELHYRITGNTEELKYSNVIEVAFFDINFKLISDDE